MQAEDGDTAKLHEPEERKGRVPRERPLIQLEQFGGTSDTRAHNDKHDHPSIEERGSLQHCVELQEYIQHFQERLQACAGLDSGDRLRAVHAK